MNECRFILNSQQGNIYHGKLVITLRRQEVPLRTLISSLILWTAILLSSCQSNQFGNDNSFESPPSPTEMTAPTQGNDAVTENTPSPIAPGSQTLIDRIKQDLAGRLAIPVEDIDLLEMSEVEWSDSSLDCPQPDMSYLQVITPGYRIILQANDTPYEYHSNRDSYFVYCDGRVPPIIPQP